MSKKPPKPRSNDIEKVIRRVSKKEFPNLILTKSVIFLSHIL